MTTTLDRPVDSVISSDNEVQDKINRVLDRLDRGEQLTRGTLKFNDNFCILGLFADESGLGEWGTIDQPHGRPQITYYQIDDRMGSSQLDRDLVKYYRMHNANGQLDISKVPAELMQFLYKIGSNYNLANINDKMLQIGYSTDKINSTLATIIRSGAIFLED